MGLKVHEHIQNRPPLDHFLSRQEHVQSPRPRVIFFVTSKFLYCKKAVSLHLYTTPCLLSMTAYSIFRSYIPYLKTVSFIQFRVH